MNQSFIVAVVTPDSIQWYEVDGLTAEEAIRAVRVREFGNASDALPEGTEITAVPKPDKPDHDPAPSRHDRARG